MCLAASVVNIGAVQINSHFFTIQIASFQQRQLAMDAAQKLKAAGQDAFFLTKQVDGKGKWYRLYLNRYASIQTARAGVNRLRQEGIISDAYIRRLPIQKRADAQSGKKSAAVLPPKTNLKFKYANPIAKQQTLPTKAPAERIRRSNEEPEGITIKKITYQIGEKKTDAALIYADGYFWPSVHLNRNGGDSRLVVSIEKVKHFEKDASTIRKNGRYIKSGSIQYDPGKNSFSLSLDLPASDGYTLIQSFNNTENAFMLVISEE